MHSLLSFLVLAAPAWGAVGYMPRASRHFLNPGGLSQHISYAHADTIATAPDPVRQLLYVAPTSDTCDGATNPTECVTSSPSTVQAILNGFTKYNVTNAAEQAALLSWMAYESADFKYNQNHYPAPGNPGQGTRCMMSPAFVREYALSIPELQASIPSGTAPTDLEATLALVQPDQYSFAAAAWYYNAHCSDAQKQQVQAGGQNNWQTALILGCISTTVDDKRVEYWKRACEALGVQVAQ